MNASELTFCGPVLGQNSTATDEFLFILFFSMWKIQNYTSKSRTDLDLNWKKKSSNSILLLLTTYLGDQIQNEVHVLGRYHGCHSAIHVNEYSSRHNRRREVRDENLRQPWGAQYGRQQFRTLVLGFIDTGLQCILQCITTVSSVNNYSFRPINCYLSQLVNQFPDQKFSRKIFGYLRIVSRYQSVEQRDADIL